MELIIFYKNNRTEVVQDVIRIEDYGGEVFSITRRNRQSGTAYDVNILKDLIQCLKVRYFSQGELQVDD